jgi:hypothetical protein
MMSSTGSRDVGFLLRSLLHAQTAERGVTWNPPEVSGDEMYGYEELLERARYETLVHFGPEDWTSKNEGIPQLIALFASEREVAGPHTVGIALATRSAESVSW